MCTVSFISYRPDIFVITTLLMLSLVIIFRSQTPPASKGRKGERASSNDTRRTSPDLPNVWAHLSLLRSKHGGSLSDLDHLCYSPET